LPDFDETFLDTALEISVNEAKRDAKIFGDSPLRLSAVVDRIEQIEDDPVVLFTVG
jgi:hypothetical protein